MKTDDNFSDKKTGKENNIITERLILGSKLRKDIEEPLIEINTDTHEAYIHGYVEFAQEARVDDEIAYLSDPAVSNANEFASPYLFKNGQFDKPKAVFFTCKNNPKHPRPAVVLAQTAGGDTGVFPIGSQLYFNHRYYLRYPQPKNGVKNED